MNDLPTSPQELLKQLESLDIHYELHEHEAVFTVAESEQVDAKIASSKLSPEALKEVKTLRDNGETAHKTGKHEDSVKMLEEALKKLG